MALLEEINYNNLEDVIEFYRKPNDNRKFNYKLKLNSHPELLHRFNRYRTTTLKNLKSLSDTAFKQLLAEELMTGTLSNTYTTKEDIINTIYRYIGIRTIDEKFNIGDEVMWLACRYANDKHKVGGKIVHINEDRTKVKIQKYITNQLREENDPNSLDYNIIYGWQLGYDIATINADKYFEPMREWAYTVYFN